MRPILLLAGLALASTTARLAPRPVAAQQLDFYIRSPQQNPGNKPNREVFLHFFGMEVTWK